MTCQRSIELMMDVLYGEELNPRLCFEFFEHLGGCPKCRQEYRELLETREMLAEWEREDVITENVVVPQAMRSFRKRRLDHTWWSILQKVAAGVLIAVGTFSIIQSTGLIPDRDITMVSEAQLTEVIHDVTLARQEDDWRVIGEALLSLKEELEARNRLELRAVYEDMQILEQRYVQALEESNRQVKTLISQ